MDAVRIKRLIGNASPELRAAGLSALYLFGSQARGDARSTSDVDLAFEVSDEAGRCFSLFDQGRLQMKLQDMLGCKVDFVERHSIHPDLKPRIERELVRLF